MYDTTRYTPPKPQAAFGLHDAVEFLEGLDYDVSALDNQGIMSLLEEVLEGLKQNEDDIV